MNVVLHGFGLYLLACQNRNSRITIQTILLMNLSVSELLLNILEMVRSCLSLTKRYYIAMDLVKNLSKYISIVIYTGACTSFYLGMVYLTADRLLSVTLNLRYNIHCTKRRAKIVLLLTWFTSLITPILIIVGADLYNFQWIDFTYMILFPLFDFGFVFLAIITYVVLFMKYKKSRQFQEKQVGTNRINKENSSAQLFRKSRFIVSVYLIGTFLVFTIVPDLTYLFVGIINNNKTDLLLEVCNISFAISNMADALIYIFVQTSIRKLLYDKAGCLLKFHCRSCKCYGTEKLDKSELTDRSNSTNMLGTTL